MATLFMPNRHPGAPRLFFALSLNDNERASILRWRDHTLAGWRGGQRVAPANLHVTLAFLGNTPAHIADSLMRSAAAIGGEPFTLDLDDCEYWPKPQILALTTRETPPALALLAFQLRQLSAELGLYQDKFDYRPHLTLVRDLRTLPPIPQPPQVSVAAHGFTLFESAMTRNGATYRPLAHWPLA